MELKTAVTYSDIINCFNKHLKHKHKKVNNFINAQLYTEPDINFQCCNMMSLNWTHRHITLFSREVNLNSNRHCSSSSQNVKLLNKNK